MRRGIKAGDHGWASPNLHKQHADPIIRLHIWQQDPATKLLQGECNFSNGGDLLPELNKAGGHRQNTM